VAACDRVVASGKYSSRNRAFTYLSRSYQHLNLNDLDRALDDTNKAIVVAPDLLLY
jgi:hypothetical protein